MMTMNVAMKKKSAPIGPPCDISWSTSDQPARPEATQKRVERERSNLETGAAAGRGVRAHSVPWLGKT